MLGSTKVTAGIQGSRLCSPFQADPPPFGTVGSLLVPDSDRLRFLPTANPPTRSETAPWRFHRVMGRTLVPALPQIYLHTRLLFSVSRKFPLLSRMNVGFSFLNQYHAISAYLFSIGSHSAPAPPNGLPIGADEKVGGRPLERGGKFFGTSKGGRALVPVNRTPPFLSPPSTFEPDRFLRCRGKIQSLSLLAPH